MYFKLTAIDYFHAMNDYSISVRMFMFMFIFNVYDSERALQVKYQSPRVTYVRQNKYVKPNSSH